MGVQSSKPEKPTVSDAHDAIPMMTTTVVSAFTFAENMILDPKTVTTGDVTDNGPVCNIRDKIS